MSDIYHSNDKSCTCKPVKAGAQKTHWIKYQLWGKLGAALANLPWQMKKEAIRTGRVPAFHEATDAKGLIRLGSLIPLDLMMRLAGDPLATLLKQRGLRTHRARGHCMRLNKQLLIIGFALGIAGISGCAKDRRLAPPVDSEKVTVTIKVPKALQALKVEAIYRSKHCTRMRSDGNGGAVEIQGFNHMEVMPMRRANTEFYDAIIPKDGGGPCQWHLSSVEFGVNYKDLSAFPSDVSLGYGETIRVFFDSNTMLGASYAIRTNADVNLIADYYPWVNESFLGGYQKQARLSNARRVRINYFAPHAEKIYFEPVFHSGLVVYSVHPKIKGKGNYPVFTYPDGSVIVDGRTEPDLKRLQAIRLKLEANK